TDLLPGLAAVRRPEDHLTAVVHGVVIERIDCHGRRPVAAILQLLRRRIERMHRPWAHGPRITDSGVETGNLIAVASAPDDIGIGRVRIDETGLAAAERLLPARVGLTNAAEQGCRLRI